MKRSAFSFRYFAGIAAFLPIIFSTEPVYASMPNGWVILSEAGKDQLIALSTALFLLFVCIPLLLQKGWNAQIAGETWSPLTYRRSLGVTLTGSVFVIFCMLAVAGVREFLSPGTWDSSGLRYEMKVVREEKLAAQTHADESRRNQDLGLLRQQGITKLRDALKKYGSENNENLPASKEESGFGDLWLVPFGSGLQYDYHPEDSSLPLVSEPTLLPNRRLSISRSLDTQEVLP